MVPALQSTRRNGDLLRVSRLKPTLDPASQSRLRAFAGTYAFTEGLRLSIIPSVDDLKPNAASLL